MVRSHEDRRHLVLNVIIKALLGADKRIKKVGKSTLIAHLTEISPGADLVGTAVRNEVPVGGRNRIDILVLNKVIVEVKRGPHEFPEAEEKIREVYAPGVPGAEYAIVTDSEEWRFYRIVRVGARVELKSVGEVRGSDEARQMLENILAEVLPKARLIPTPDNIVKILGPLKKRVSEIKAVIDKYIESEKIRPLYEMFKNYMGKVYSGLSEEAMKELYAKHTILQMIVASAATRALVEAGIIDNPADPLIATGGEAFEREVGERKESVSIVLPYLLWWRRLREIGEKDVIEQIEELARLIWDITGLFDWSGGVVQDAFRELYELLLEPGERRKLGEYYTPPWLVEYVIDEVERLAGKLYEKTVMDPFCGSGTFLVHAFWRKVEEGRDPDEALDEVVGFDINPLAVSIARAELFLAYLRAGGKRLRTPLVFHVDTLRLWGYGERATLEDWMGAAGRKNASPFDRYEDAIREFSRLIATVSGPTIRITKMSELAVLESMVADALREASRCRGDASRVEGCLRRALAEARARYRFEQGPIGRIADALAGSGSERVKEAASEVVGAIAEIVEEHGDGVWASSLVSRVAYYLADVRADVILTNPPWFTLLRAPAEYRKSLHATGKRILEAAGVLGLLGDVANRNTQSIVGGSNFSSIALYHALSSADAVGMVLPESASYRPGSHQKSGRLLTYAALAAEGAGRARIVYVDRDAFCHGALPTLVIAAKGEKRDYRCAIMWARFREREDKPRSCEERKNLPLCGAGWDTDCVEIEVEDTPDDYGPSGYFAPLIDYHTTTSDTLAERLGVANVVAEGAVISGIFGGERKGGAERRAGLHVVWRQERPDGTVEFRLAGMSGKSYLRAPKRDFDEHLRQLVYVGGVFPFGLLDIVDIVYAERVEEVRAFIERAAGRGAVEDAGDLRRLRRLLRSVKTGKNPLTPGRWHVVYRCDRWFAAIALKPGPKHVAEHHVSILAMPRRDGEKLAHYYAAALNYLAYKAWRLGVQVERHQFTRPLHALLALGLDARSVDPGLAEQVAALSRELHGKAPRLYAGRVRRGDDVSKAFRILEADPTWRRLVELLDAHLARHGIDEEKARRILLKWVGEGEKNN